jgi:hypothetical protein
MRFKVISQFRLHDASINAYAVTALASHFMHSNKTRWASCHGLDQMSTRMKHTGNMHK